MAEKSLGEIKLNEESDKCLFCIPIDFGVKLIGVLTVLITVKAVHDILETTYYDSEFIVVYSVCSAPLFYSAFLFMKYFANDSSETRMELPKACIFVIFSGLASSAWTLFYLLVLNYKKNWFDNFLRTCFVSAIDSIFYLYFAGVCHRYQEMWLQH